MAVNEQIDNALNEIRQVIENYAFGVTLTKRQVDALIALYGYADRKRDKEIRGKKATSTAFDKTCKDITTIKRTLDRIKGRLKYE